MSSWHIGSVYKLIKGFVGNVLNVYMAYETMKGLVENIPNLLLNHRA